MISPSSAVTLSTVITSSAATRYCLPPVLMTANISIFLVFVTALGAWLRAGFLTVDLRLRSCPASEVRDTSPHVLTRTSEAKGHEQPYASSAAFRFEVPKRACC